MLVGRAVVILFSCYCCLLTICMSWREVEGPLRVFGIILYQGIKCKIDSMMGNVRKNARTMVDNHTEAGCHERKYVSFSLTLLITPLKYMLFSLTYMAAPYRNVVEPRHGRKAPPMA